MKKSLYAVLCLVLFSLFIQVVYAEGDIDLTDWPNQLSRQLNIGLFPAQLLASSIVLCLFLFPTMMLSRNPLAVIVVAFTVMSFCIAMTWLPVWIFLVVGLIIGIMFAGRMRDWITGGYR